MRLACQQRGRPKEIALINVVEDFVVDAVWRLRNFHATLTYQIKRIAWFPFAENYFAGFFRSTLILRAIFLMILTSTAFNRRFFENCFIGRGPALAFT